ncbi:MAG: chaperonin GroES [Patiriisocius sp.]|jgi:chaperonin GroES
MALNIKPLADRVVIQAKSPEEKTSSGIFIPDTAKEKQLEGKVMAVGKGLPDVPMTLKKGDKVLFGKFSGTEINIGGSDYLIMKEADVLAII